MARAAVRSATVAEDDVPAAPAPGEGQVLLGTGAAPLRAPALSQVGHLYRLGDPSLSELELEPLLEELLSRAVDILGVDTAAILLLDPDTQELVARAAH